MSAAQQELTYFRIHGKVGPTTQRPHVRDFLTTVKTLPVVFGRSPTHGNHILLDDADGTISREHIKVDFSTVNHCYEITCLSKNGAIVDKHKINKDGTAQLKQNSAVRVGTAKFYISFPKEQRSEGKDDGAVAIKFKNTSHKKRKVDSSPHISKHSRTESVSDVGDSRDGHNSGGGSPRGATPSGSADAGSPSPPQDGSSSSGGPIRATTPIDADDDEDSEIMSSAIYGTKSGIKGGYYLYIVEALESGVLPVRKGGGHDQKDIVAFMYKKHSEELREVREQSLKKGVYSLLAKHFTRIEEPGEPLRWKLN